MTPWPAPVWEENHASLRRTTTGPDGRRQPGAVRARVRLAEVPPGRTRVRTPRRARHSRTPGGVGQGPRAGPAPSGAVLALHATRGQRGLRRLDPGAPGGGRAGHLPRPPAGDGRALL